MGRKPDQKKEGTKKNETFAEFPEEIRERLEEVNRCTKKQELVKLAKQYGIIGASGMRKDELSDELFKVIKSGKEKNITEYERRGYIQVEYRCSSCKYTIRSNIPKGREPKPKYCKKCGKKLMPKII